LRPRPTSGHAAVPVLYARLDERPSLRPARATSGPGWVLSLPVAGLAVSPYADHRAGQTDIGVTPT